MAAYTSPRAQSAATKTTASAAMKPKSANPHQWMTGKRAHLAGAGSSNPTRAESARILSL